MKRQKKTIAKPQNINLTITHIGHGGDGVGTHNAKPVYIPKSAGGDTIMATVIESKDDYKGNIVSIQNPSQDRTEAPCPHYNSCGGCDLQHINQTAYRAWKIDKIKSTLERSGIKPKYWDDPIFIAPDTRRRTTLALIKTNDKSLTLGYYSTRSHTITDIKNCLILTPELNNTLTNLRPYLLKLAPTRKAVGVLLQEVNNSLDVVLTGEWGVFNLPQQEILAEMIQTTNIARISKKEKDHGQIEILLEREPIKKKFGILNVKLPPAAFLQASDEGEEALMNAVLKNAKDYTNVADLFCGCGTFTGALLGSGANVYAADSDIASINTLHHPRLKAEQRNLFKDPLKQKELSGFDCVVFDPPRAGAKEQTSILAHSDIPRIIAVSCNPATFARDAKILIDGDYNLRSIQLIDQFVYSAHLELVAVFDK